MDDTARGFYAEVVTDLSAVIQGVAEDKPDLTLRASMSVLATFVTDVNRIARAVERIADAQENVARQYVADMAATRAGKK